MQFNEAIFKAYDIRGVVGVELNAQVARGVGRALADLLETPGPVAVGYDMRPASVEFAAALREGVIEQGRDVIDIGLVTSDMIYFAVGKLGLAGGAMVTASHNPGEYDGIKLCRRDAAPIGHDTGLSQIEETMRGDSYKHALSVGHVHHRDVTDEWIKHAISFVDVTKWPSYRIGIDAGNGMAGAVLPHLVPLVPVKLSRLYWELDGTFPNHPASPMDPANLEDLNKLVKRETLDFGIAFDGDGDRAFLVTAKGKQVTGSIMIAMISEAMLKRYPHSTIVYNATCGRIVPETIDACGGRAVRTKVGHPFVTARMRELGAEFGGEHAGHFYFKDNYYTDSGLIAALVAIDVLASSGLRLEELVARYDRYADTPELNFKVTDKEAIIAKLADEFSDGEQDQLDGLTVNYPDWWFNVRPSNTEPYLRLNVEAKDETLLKSSIAKLESTITS